MLITTKQVSATEENVLCYFSALLVVQFTHRTEGNMHTFERTSFQSMYQYPLDLSDHNAMIAEHFSKAYHGITVDSIYKAIQNDYSRLLKSAYDYADRRFAK